MQPPLSPCNPEGAQMATFVAASSSISYKVGAGGIASKLLGNVVGTTSPRETNHCGVVNNATRWLYLEAISTGTLVIDTRGSSIPTVFAVYEKLTFGHSPLPVACGLPSPSDGGAGVRRARFQARAGTTYAIVVDGLNGSTGGIRLNCALGTPPTLAETYTNLVMSTGSRLVLRVDLTQGLPIPALQWRLNGLPIAGATNEILTVDSVGGAAAGDYSVLVSNAIDVVEQKVARVDFDRSTFRFAESAFDLDVEGWAIAQSQLSLAFSSAGNPSGCVSVNASPGNEAWFWEAPQGFWGDRSAAYGGWLQFDLHDSAASNTNQLQASVWWRQFTPPKVVGPGIFVTVQCRRNKTCSAFCPG